MSKAGHIRAAVVIAALVLVLGVLFHRHAERQGPMATPSPDDVQTSEPDTAVTEGGLSWQRPRFPERDQERREFVQRFVEPAAELDSAVLDAMRHVPRHLFVPADAQADAYRDYPLPIGHGQTISQPSLVALMTQLLDVDAGDSVLEIGTGSGFQAVVLSELTPHVYTIEIIEELADEAARRLAELGYSTVEVRHADGYYGWEEHAPFDAIIVTAAAGHVPPPLLEQLEAGGRMVIPVGGVFEVQRLLLVTKGADGETRTESLLPVRFVPMTGRAQEGE